MVTAQQISAFIFATQYNFSTSQSQHFKCLAIFYFCIAQFVSDLFRNSKDRFSCDEAHLIINAFIVNCINGKINMYLLNKRFMLAAIAKQDGMSQTWLKRQVFLFGGSFTTCILYNCLCYYLPFIYSCRQDVVPNSWWSFNDDRSQYFVQVSVTVFVLGSFSILI